MKEEENWDNFKIIRRTADLSIQNWEDCKDLLVEEVKQLNRRWWM